MRRTAAAGWPPGGPEHGRWDPGPALAPLRIDLAHLPAPLRYELAYGIDRARRHPDPPVLSNPALHHLIWRLGRTGVGSLLEHEEMRWPRLDGQPGTGPMRVPFLRFTIDRLDELAGRGGHEAEYARDTWRLRRLGYTGDQAGWIYQFEGITQPWLREAAKRFVRWRIAVAHSPSGMSRDVLTLTRLSAALTDIAGPGASVQQLDRVVIERLSSLLTELGVTATGRGIALSSISAFFTAARQHEWLPDLPSQTGVYPEDVPRRPSLPGRAISEFVMTQLEAPASLARLTDPRWALLLPLLMQTGLRLRDALRLAPDCVVRDRQNAPYLRYYNHKMNREALVPISGELADAITARARQLADRFPSGTWLFPQERINRDGLHPITNSVAARALQAWLGDCELRDEQGKPVHVTAHQFRHTLGTRLINNDVPQDVVRRILDHTSTEMTAHYARLHDTTIREHWERARKVSIAGQTVLISSDSPLADAAWMKQHLSRATMSLPNGYCGLPLQQTCPHANACLTCPVFITTPEFLDAHREQLAHTQLVIQGAEHRGQLRLVEMNQRIASNLTNIITALETEDGGEPDPGGDHAR